MSKNVAVPLIPLPGNELASIGVVLQGAQPTGLRQPQQVHDHLLKSINTAQAGLVHFKCLIG